MKIYVIEKKTITCAECFDHGIYENEICKEAGAFDNFETAFNTIFSCVKQDIDDKRVVFSIGYGGFDDITVEYWVTELELNRTEA